MTEEKKVGSESGKEEIVVKGENWALQVEGPEVGENGHQSASSGLGTGHKREWTERKETKDAGRRERQAGPRRKEKREWRVESRRGRMKMFYRAYAEWSPRAVPN